MLGDRLKYYRVKKKLSQESVANILNVSRQTISKYENNINEPDLKTLEKLANIYNVDLLLLLKEEEHQRVSIFHLGITIFSLLFLFILIYLMPSIIPAHYNIYGEVTRYGSKYEFLLFIIPILIFFGIDTLIAFLVSDKEAMKISRIILIIVQIIFIVMYSYFSFISMKEINYVKLFVGFNASLFLTISILVNPKFTKQNKILGFRTSLTLNNLKAWNDVNMFLMISSTILGLLMYILTLLLPNNVVYFVLILPFIEMIIVYIKYYFYQKKVNL